MKYLIKKIANNPKMRIVWWLLVALSIISVAVFPQIGGYFAVVVILFGFVLYISIDDKKKEG
jgi:hypothetical protein